MSRVSRADRVSQVGHVSRVIPAGRAGK